MDRSVDDAEPSDDSDLSSTVLSGVGSAASGPAAALHRHPGFLAVVFVGGAVGTAARALLTVLLTPWHGLGNPGATLIINLLGCLALGMVLETLGRRGPDVGRRRLLRLGVGTGFCGGFTTYSTLALDVALDLRRSAPWQGIGYAALSLVLGLVITAIGIRLAGRWAPGRSGVRR